MLKEKYGERDLSYSAWHRPDSVKRFINFQEARVLSMIDLDVTLYLEYMDGNRKPLILIEVARDVGQANKCSDVTRNLAILADKPCLITLYTLSKNANPADRSCFDIEKFRVKKIHPPPPTQWKIFTPKEYAEMILNLRKWEIARMDRQAKFLA